MVKKWKDDLLQAAGWTAAASGFAALLLTNVKYRLWFSGQKHLFIADRCYLFDKLCRRGGISELTASCVTSFFHSPTLSALICAAILTLISALTYLSIRNSSKLIRFSLSLIVPLFLSLTFSDWHIHSGETAAFTLTCLGVALVARCPRKLIAAVVVAPALYWLGALSPSLFYPPNAGTMPWIHWLCWAALPLCLLIGHFLKKKVIALAVLILCAVPALAAFKAFDRQDNERTSQLEWLCTAGDWDGVIASFKGNVRSDAQANYLNLALCEKGILLDDLFNYRQRGPFALISDVKSQDPIDHLRLSRVLFSMGNMPASQSTAFNANQVFEVHPELQKMITQIDLMRGAYSVAGKNLDFLAKTNCRKWAESHRRFLYNDAAVEADPILGNGRRSFPEEEAFVLYSNPMDDLYRIVDADPCNRKAVQYALAYLMLAKDMKKVAEYADRYIDAEPLPVSVQECLAFYSYYCQSITDEFASSHGMSEEELAALRRYDAEFCRRHGVSDDVFTRMDEFNRKAALVNSGKAGRSELASFNRTFWYYLMFTDIQ